MKKKINIIINETNQGLRLDKAITMSEPEITRSALKNHSTSILVNNKTAKLSYKCRLNDSIDIMMEWEEYENIIPEDFPLKIIYEDDNYIVINKDYNRVVHPAKGNIRGTLLNALVGLNKDLAITEDSSRIGVVHRLDKETSGIIIFAKHIQAHSYLSSLFKNRNILKKYHAVVKGFFTPSKLIIENNIGRDPNNRKKMTVLKERGKKSITIIENVLHYGEYSYLDIKIETGRTHQIRVHLSNYGNPVLGDLIYARKDKNHQNIPLCLVAYKLSFYDKFSCKQLTFEIPDPVFITDFINNCK